MARHAGVYIIHTTKTQVPLNRVPMASVEFSHERASTRDLPTETFMFDYILNYGEALPTWIKPGTRIAVAARTNGRVLFLGRLEQPGVTPIRPGRARVRIRAVSDLNSWGNQTINKRVNTGKALVHTPAHFKTNIPASLNAIDPTQAAPTLELGPETITAEYVQSGSYWSEGVTMADLIKRAGNSFLQPYVGVKTGTWHSDIRTLNYTVTTGADPLIYPSESHTLDEGNVVLSGEWRLESSELVNTVDLGMFKGAVNIGDANPDARKASSIDYGFQRRVIASVNDIGTREIQVPTFWTGGQYFSGQNPEDALTQLQKEIAAPQYVTEQPIPSPTVITLADVAPATLAGMKAGAIVSMAQNHPYRGLGKRHIEATVLSVLAKPNVTNSKSDSWTADITIAAQPNMNGDGAAPYFKDAHFRWNDYPVNWYTI